MTQGRFDTGMALGRQMTIEFYDCDSHVLADPMNMERLFLNAAEKARATIISSHFHAFSPQGVSGVVVIAESHFTVHAWPEHDYAAVDIFTCGESIDFDMAVKVLREGMKSECVIISCVMNRGVISNHGLKYAAAVEEDPSEKYSLSWRSRFDRVRAHGFSASIDLYNCAPDLLTGSAAFKKLIEVIAAGIDSTAIGEYNQYQTGNGLMALRQDFVDGSLTGHIDSAFNAVYLDIFCSRFFDPRPVGESAIDCFQGKHYRLQIAIRE